MRKILAISISAIFLVTFLLPVNPSEALAASPGLPITAPSALLLDVSTQKVIYSKAPHLRRHPASTTKVMTVLVVLDRISLDQIVVIPDWVRWIEPSKAYVRPGERYRVRDLLHATLISSANDAAEVLGVTVAGSRSRFAKWMNEKAKRLGCHDTHFVNPSGLPPGNQYSTAYDLALIMKEAWKSPFIVDSMSRRTHTIKSLGGRKIHLKNHNKLLGQRNRSIIGKTGWTQKSKHCFVGRIQWMGREVLVSLLGSHRLWHDLKILLDYQFGVMLYKIRKNQKRWSASETRKIQSTLSRAGYSPGPIDGKFGPQSVRAVELFQKHHGLRPDGIVGPRTCKKLTPFGFPRSYCQ